MKEIVIRASDAERLGFCISYINTDREFHKAEALKNARLISAAPDLLEALQELADLVEAMRNGEYEPDSFTTQPAYAAIAKALGQ